MNGTGGGQIWLLAPLLCVVLVMQAAKWCLRPLWVQWNLPLWWCSEVFDKVSVLIGVKLVSSKEWKDLRCPNLTLSLASAIHWDSQHSELEAAPFLAELGAAPMQRCHHISLRGAVAAEHLLRGAQQIPNVSQHHCPTWCCPEVIASVHCAAISYSH